jgi:hypothetical protein
MQDIRVELARQNPDHKIEVIHIRNQPDLAVPMIRALVVVDGEMDQGIIITRPSQPNANDNRVEEIAISA